MTCLIDANNAVQARYSYDPYGSMLAMSGALADANKYRFSSKEWNGNSGLYYYGFRFHDPNSQRWLNRDPIGEQGGINLYSFAGNNPVNLFDLLGLEIRCLNSSEKKQLDNVINGLSSHDVQSLQREALDLKGRTFKVDTDLSSPKPNRTLGYVTPISGDMNTIYLSPDLFIGSQNFINAAMFPTQKGNYNINGTLMGIMIHENEHLNSYNPYADTFFWLQNDHVHDWIDNYVDQIGRLTGLNKKQHIPPTPLSDDRKSECPNK